MELEGFAADIISSRQAFDSMKTEWDELLERSAADCIFLRWGWIAAWLDALPSCPELYIIALRDTSGVLRGLAPYSFTELRLLGTIRYRTLRVLAEEDTGGEYGDWILDDNATAGVRESMAEEHRRLPLVAEDAPRTLRRPHLANLKFVAAGRQR